MTLSLIIPTLDRPDDLRRALASVAQNSVSPDEVLIIEQGDLERTKEIAGSFQGQLAIRVLPLAEKSLTRARNLGVTESTAPFIMFMDDDTELESDYIETLVAYASVHPDVYGVVGRDLNNTGAQTFMDRVRALLSALFCGNTFSGTSRVRRSGYNVLKNTGDQEETVEWLSGCAFAVRRSIFDEGIRFNDMLIRWSLGEDVFFSFQIHTRYPGSLRYVPALRFRHHSSQTSRLTNLQIMRMKIIYKYIFWKKEVYGGSFLNLICYLWHQIGMSAFDVLSARSLPVFCTILRTYVYLISHFRRIEQGRIAYNDFILHGGRSI